MPGMVLFPSPELLAYFLGGFLLLFCKSTPCFIAIGFSLIDLKRKQVIIFERRNKRKKTDGKKEEGSA